MSTRASPGPGSGTRMVSRVTGAFLDRTTAPLTLWTMGWLLSSPLPSGETAQRGLLGLAGSPRRKWCGGVSCKGVLSREAGLDLGRGRVGGRGAVREEHGGHGAVAAVELLHEFGGAFDFLDVDLGVADALRIQQLLQPVVVAAPGGRKHGDGSGIGGEVHEILLKAG